MGTLSGEIPALTLRTVLFWVRGLVQQSAEVNDLRNGGKNNVSIVRLSYSRPK